MVQTTERIYDLSQIEEEFYDLLERTIFLFNSERFFRNKILCSYKDYTVL